MISIIVPSYRRRERLRRCLAALARQDGGPYETIVVDDGSPEPLAPVCAEAGDWVTCIRQANAGPAAARNTGARAASGDILCFTDDDCCPHPGWAKSLWAAQGGDPRRLVGGRVVNGLPDNLFSETSQSISDYLYDWHQAEGQGERFFTSNNLACAKAAYLGLGGFDESFRLAAGEDREFGIRWKREVGPLVFTPEAIVRHDHSLTLGGFWRQQANYGRGAQHLRRRSAQAAPQAVRQAARPARRLEKPRFYAGLMLHPLRRRNLALGHRVALSVLAVVSQLAVTRGYLDQVRRGSEVPG